MRGLFLSFALVAVAGQALAQGGASPWEVTREADLAVIVAPGGSSQGAVEREDALYEIGFGLSGERTFQNGWTFGGRVVLRASADHPARPAGVGNIAFAGQQQPAGAFSRLSTGPGFEDAGPRGSLESAYLFLETGYGEFSAGRDIGIAARFHEGDVSALSHARLADPYLDVSGISNIITRPDITGPSVKASYVTPRLLGVRAGISYTPDSEARGLDRDATRSDADIRPGLSNALEVGLNASRRLRESGLRLRGGLSYSTAEVDAPEGFAARYDDRIDVVAAGAEIEWDDNYRIGINWLSADEGLASGGDYVAWSLGLGYERGDWRGSLTYGEAELDASGLDSTGFSLAMSRQFNDHIEVGAAWQGRDLGPQGGLSFIGGAPQAEFEGVVVEITLGFEN